MTGILPIKKYGTHSALNMFSEYSMTEARDFAPYFGFTEKETLDLCVEYGADFEEVKVWYDGYHMEYRSGRGFKAAIKSISVYSPKSLVDALLAGGNIQTDISSFANDMTTFHSKDDVLTLLVHLGYLNYCKSKQTVSIPNKEVSEVYLTSIMNVRLKNIENDMRNLLN